MAKNIFYKFSDDDLYYGHHNILLLKTPTEAAGIMLAEIEEAMDARNKDYMGHKSHERVRNMWITKFQPISPEMTAVFDQRIPGWNKVPE